MQSPPKPPSEASRLARLRLLNVLDTQPDERFDRLTRMARHLFSSAGAMLTLVDSDRLWFKSHAGLKLQETARDTSFCGHTILQDDIMLVPNAADDPRFHDNPLVTGAPNIRFYAACTLRIGNENLGTLCIFDQQPRQFSDDQKQLLRDLARIAEQELAALELATTDPLTLLANRRGFEILSRHALSACRRFSRPAALLYFDLNCSSQPNDTRGHAATDQALRLFAFALLSIYRESDVIARLGGDEFVVLLTNTSASVADVTLPRLRDWLEKHANHLPTGAPIDFSVAYFPYDPALHRSVEDLLKAANTLLQQQKSTSR